MQPSAVYAGAQQITDVDSDMAGSAPLRSEFANWMRDERGWSLQTRRTRNQTLDHARRWLHDNGRPMILRAHREDVLDYISSARHPRTRNRKLADLRAFYVFAIEAGYVEHDPSSGIRRIKEPRNLPRPLTQPQAATLLRASLIVSERAYVLVALLLYTGMRREEAVQLVWSDVDLRSGKLRVFGKGSKERMIPINGRLVDLLSAWRMYDGNGSAHVFPSSQRSGLPISPTTLWHDVDDSAQIAGLQDIVSPHVLRHTFATECLRLGSDIRRVQALLGHESLKSTQIYTKVYDEDLVPDVARLDFER